jgi:UDP-N-acetylglucosamine 2-epimerase (non-hydrolysing)/GDP/UDP-N,N'-diacetylbacillosamine 2-epimerase (hydrolysing)
MGEEPWRITFSGSLSLDHLRRERLRSRDQVEKELGLKIRPDTLLCIFHPVTLMENTAGEAEEFFAALRIVRNPMIFVYPNADAGSRQLIRRAEKLGAERGSRVLVNLEHRTYLSLLKHAGALVGNSSSGIIESTSLEVAAVNIGIRQRGREHAGNVIDVPAQRTAIRRGIHEALSPEFRRSIGGLKSPYGDGDAAKIITRILTKAPLGRKLLFKHAELL